MKLFLRWVASAALLAIAFHLLDWTAIASAAAKLSLGSFAVAVLIGCAHFVPLAARWHLLAGKEQDWYGSSARYLYANLLNSVSPANVAGDVYRFFAFRTAQPDHGMLVAVLVRERLLGLLSMLIGLVFAAGWIEFRDAGSPWLSRALGFGGAAALALIFLLPRAAARVRMAESWRRRILAAAFIAASRRDAAVLGWSIAALALWVATVQFIVARLGIDVPLAELLAVVTMAELVRAVPLTVQGVGLREGAFAAFFGAFGHLKEEGFVVGAVAYLALSVALVATGAIGALMLGREEQAG